MHTEDMKQKQEEVIEMVMNKVPENWKERVREMVNNHRELEPEIYQKHGKTVISFRLLDVIEPEFLYDKDWGIGDKFIDSEGKSYMIVYDCNSGTTDYKLLSLESGMLLEGKQYRSLKTMKEKLQFWSTMGGIKMVRHIAKEREEYVSL